MIITKDTVLTDEDLVKLDTFVNAAQNPVTYLAIDPGQSNGVCGYDDKFYIQFMYTINEEELRKFLDIFASIKVCVIENFILYPDKMKHQVYSDMLTSRVIGRVENWAKAGKIDLVKQPASIKNTGYAWIGKKPYPKSHPMHHSLDAHVHFIYWAIKNKKMKPEMLIKNDVKDE